MKRRHAFGIAAMALMLVVALFTAGCNGKTRELKEGVTGIWRLESATSDDMSAALTDALGMSSFVVFDEDGTFSVRLLIAGKTIEREGTWKVKDDQIVVDVPEMKEPEGGESSPADLSGPAIEGMVVTVEEGGLSLNGEHLACERVSQERYDEIVEASASKLEESAE